MSYCHFSANGSFSCKKPIENFTTVATVPTQPRSGPPYDLKLSTNGRCGLDYGNTVCPSNQCCSSANPTTGYKGGECGGIIGTKDTKFCTSSTGVKPVKFRGDYFGAFDGNPIATDGKCGYNNNNTYCPNNQCCSSSGLCGGIKNTTDTTFCKSNTNATTKVTYSRGNSGGSYDSR